MNHMYVFLVILVAVSSSTADDNVATTDMTTLAPAKLPLTSSILPPIDVTKIPLNLMIPSTTPSSKAVQSMDLKTISTDIATHNPMSAQIVNDSTKSLVPSTKAPKETNTTTTDSELDKCGKGKFCKYMSPICKAQDKIDQQQLFRLQKQFKKFVELTNGKLAICFLEHHKMDLTLNPLSRENLATICSTFKNKSDGEGSFMEFENCLNSNSDSKMTAELNRIITARQNRMRDSPELKDNEKMILSHEEEEMAFINNIVTTMFDKNSSLSNATDIKLVDLRNSSQSPTVTQLNSTAPEGLSKGSLAATKGLMNDPNTVVVVVDDSDAKAKSALIASPSLIAALGTSKPIFEATTTISPNSDSVQPHDGKTQVKESLENKITSLISISTTTTREPKHAETKQLTVKPIINNLPSTTGGPKTVTTTNPKGFTEITQASKMTTKNPAKSILKPIKMIESLQDMIKRHQKEKREFEQKLKAERERLNMYLKSKQNEMDTRKAIKALQLQREASNHATDSRLHQLEHDRQMSIDPVGHSLKHQQYAINQMAKGKH